MRDRSDVPVREPTSAGAAARARLLAGQPVAERSVRLAGIATAVLEGGEGPPVVLLHGPAANATHWIRVIPRLAESHRVIAPDLPGHGASGTPAGPPDVETVIEWLTDLVGDTCASPPAVVGYAIGGAIAARFAAERSDRLSRLVLVDSFGLVPFEPDPGFGRAIEEFLTAPNESSHDRLWQFCAHDLDGLRRAMGPAWEPFRAYNLDRAQGPSAAAAGALMERFAVPIPPDALARITVPTTLIWGRHDLATPIAVAEAAAARNGWPLRVIEDSADDPAVERPEGFLDALRAALGEDVRMPGQATAGARSR